MMKNLILTAKKLALKLASFPGPPGTFYHVQDVKGRQEVDTT